MSPPQGTTTRWWWIRHAPVVGHGGRIYGQDDHDCDCSDTETFRRLAGRPRGCHHNSAEIDELKKWFHDWRRDSVLAAKIRKEIPARLLLRSLRALAAFIH